MCLNSVLPRIRIAGRIAAFLWLNLLCSAHYLQLTTSSSSTTSAIRCSRDVRVCACVCMSDRPTARAGTHVMRPEMRNVENVSE